MTARRLSAWAPALLAMVVIWGLSALELQAGALPVSDKAAHLVEFALLGAIVTRACVLTWPRLSRVRTATFAVYVTVLFGLVDEIHQARVPGRSSELLDLVADGLGALVGAVAFVGILRVGALLRDTFASTPVTES